MSQREVPLLLVATENVGLRKATPALAYLTSWAFTMSKHGGEPITADDYAHDWGVSIATAFRHQAAIREAFEGVDLAQVAKLVDEQTGGRRFKLPKAVGVARKLAPEAVLVDIED